MEVAGEIIQKRDQHTHPIPLVRPDNSLGRANGNACNGATRIENSAILSIR